MFFFDPISLIILIPGFLLGVYAQIKMTATFSHYSKISTVSGYPAFTVTKRLLDNAGIYGISIIQTSGNLTDHYDPSKNLIALSDSVYSSTSIGAIGVAAHEVGHAVQRENGYLPYRLRSILVPVVNFSTMAFLPLIIIGFVLEALIGSGAGTLSNFVINLSIILYGMSTLFALVTLPVEFNASKRAAGLLEEGIMTAEEVQGVKKVLSAAALTYVAAFFTSLLYFLRFIYILGFFRRK